MASPVGSFRHGRDGGVLETDLHIEILPSVHIAAQRVTAIGVTPEIKLVAVALGKQQTIIIQQRLGRRVLRVGTAKIHGIVVNISARR